MIKAVFPGSFDPPTFGHLNIIERARVIFDEIHVVVAINSKKTALFSPEERLILLNKLVSPWDNVFIDLHDGLIVDYAKKNDITVFIRGIRNIQDFMYEFDISLINKALESKIETVFIPTEQRFFVLNSSVIKEVAAFGGDTSSMAPAIVVEALKKKFPSQQKNK